MGGDEEWGPCRSREEWLLMYELGLSPQRIAKLCRVESRAVRRVTDSADRKDEEFFHRRSVVHDQPALPRVRPLLTWQQRYGNLVWFVDTMGRLPRQGGSTWERQCHGFMYQQRHAHHAGTLTNEQIQALERVEGWYVSPRAPDHWQLRFDAYIRFVEEHGRHPRVESRRGGEERSLKVWLWSQRNSLGMGRLSAARMSLLDRALPGWRGRTRLGQR